jgi:hypothetical protein
MCMVSKTSRRSVKESAMLRVGGLVLLFVAFCLSTARADEGGISFWVPGQFGSLAAVPAQPGWSAAGIYYQTTVNAGGNVAAARQFTIGRFSRTLNVDLNANLHARDDLIFLNGTYVLPTPVLGGQFAVGMTGAVGRSSATIDGTLTAALGPFSVTRSGSIADARYGASDLYPMATLRWNQGVHNYMTYVTGDVPVGTYNPASLANVGIGHGAIDAGAGYTYFNPQTGHEFSAVSGLTYNLKNHYTDYRNGIDWHLDWGASKFLSKQLFVGAVGYFYNQLTADSGSLAILGDVKSSVIGAGPQIGYLFPVGDKQGYINLKGYYEFDAHNRPSGWNTWLTFSISPAAQAAPISPRLVHK